MEPAEGSVDEQLLKRHTLTQDSVTTNGSPAPRLSLTTGSTSMDIVTTENDIPVVPLAISTTPLPAPTAETNNVEIKEFEELVAEPLDKILENKLVKEKKLELDKKLDNLRKKHEKKKMSLNSQKSTDFSEKRSKLANMKLVKRLSSKNMYASNY